MAGIGPTDSKPSPAKVNSFSIDSLLSNSYVPKCESSMEPKDYSVKRSLDKPDQPNPPPSSSVNSTMWTPQGHYSLSLHNLRAIQGHNFSPIPLDFIPSSFNSQVSQFCGYPCLLQSPAFSTRNFEPSLSSKPPSSTRRANLQDLPCSDAKRPSQSRGINSTTGKSKNYDKMKSRGPRSVFNNLQRRKLEIQFKKDKYINKTEKLRLAAEIGLSGEQIKVWFQNRRMKERMEDKAILKADSVTSSPLASDQSCSSE